MTHVSSSSSAGWSPISEPMTPAQALRWAWMAWTALLLTPFVLFVVTIAVIGLSAWGDGGGGSAFVSNLFFAISMIWLLVAVPGAFVLRSHCFRAYWEGGTVDPRSYLRGMLTIWLAAEIGGIVALLGCLLSGMLMPCLLPAAVAFMLFTPFWPTGEAMVHPVGAVDDDQIFREPR
ncbi:MAG TPA: hypothetical protein VF184_07800 [Phycisphaeraceae bacterium]